MAEVIWLQEPGGGEPYPLPKDDFEWGWFLGLWIAIGFLGMLLGRTRR